MAAVQNKYLVTGAWGFLGRYIHHYLVESEYVVTTLGKYDRNDIVCDLSINIPNFPSSFNVVVHAAAMAHIIPKTETEAKAFFDVNFQGTKNLCEGMEKTGSLPFAFVFISTVAVYGLEQGEAMDEKTPLNGTSPYAKSKIAAEIFLTDWCRTNNIKLSILRLPLIVGKNPPANLGAMIKGIANNRYFNIGGGKAKKSMVMASDVAAYIPTIAAIGGTYHLTDGYHPSFKELADLIAKQLNKRYQKNIPYEVAKTMAVAGFFLGEKAPLKTDQLKKIMATLTFDDTLAKNTFGWLPNKVLETFRIK